MANEKRLIDANALMDEMSATFQQCVWEGCESEECQIALETIMESPTVDAVEVVHGRWIPINTIHGLRFQCDQCKHYVDAGADRNYCPNCGAKMDGDGSDS